MKIIDQLRNNPPEESDLTKGEGIVCVTVQDNGESAAFQRLIALNLNFTQMAKITIHLEAAVQQLKETMREHLERNER